jgi:alkane 1-monooxygenase
MQATTVTGTRKNGRLRHVIACLMPLSLFVLFALGLVGRGYWLLLPTLSLVLVLPLLDRISGWQDTARFEKEDFSWLEVCLLGWNPRLYVLLYMASVLYVAMVLDQFSGVEIAMLIMLCSFLGGIAFAAAHELLHAKGRIDQFLQRVVTTFLFYPHYKLIHVRSHHVHTSTNHDENTAWLNESIYSYLARTIPGSAIRCWQLETRLGNEGRSGLRAVLQNKMTWYAAGQVALLVAMFLLASNWGFLFYAAQVAGAHIVLESVNYIQHYGLLREKRDGAYEKNGAEHSWDTYHYFSSYAAFRVGHHSYHHLAVQPYYLLGTEPEAPKLPVGYFLAIGLVFLPPFWRRVIHPRLQGELSAAGAST